MLLIDRDGDAGAVVEEVVGVQSVVAQEFVSRAVKRVGARLGDEVHHAAAGMAELGLKAIGVHSELGDRFDRRRVGGDPALGKRARGVGRDPSRLVP